MECEKKKNYKACLFDLDGTLVDTIADIAYAANHSLEEMGYPPCEEESYKYKVGNGMRMICKRALPEEVREDEQILQDMIRRYDQYYSAHCCDRSRAYPGIPELIRDLRKAGVLLAVISNKPHPQTQIVMQTIFHYHDDTVCPEGPEESEYHDDTASQYKSDEIGKGTLCGEKPMISGIEENDFFYVQGQCDRFPRKPEPEVLLDCIARTGLPKEEIIYVGDSNVDVEFARRAGIPCIGVTWGFRGREELEEAGAAYIAETAEEVFSYITG